MVGTVPPSLTEADEHLADHFETMTDIHMHQHHCFNYVLRISDIKAGAKSLFATDELVQGPRTKIECMGNWDAVRAQASAVLLVGAQAMIQKVLLLLLFG